MSLVLANLPFLVAGLGMTLLVSGIVVAASLVTGVGFGLVLALGPGFARWPVRVLVDVVRGIPILVLIFAVYYGLPALKVNLSAFWAAVLALTLFKTAQVAETARGAVSSIPRGQTEAAKSIGLRFWRRFLDVIAPQAARRFLPPWINGVTDAVKGSALVSLVGIVDLMQSLQQVIGRTYEPMPFYLLGALIYIAINASLSGLGRHLERRFAHVAA